MEGIKTFYCSNLAWYAESIGRKEIEIMISLNAKDGGTHGEFAIRWDYLGSQFVPYIHAYDDSWAVLASMSDVLEMLGSIDNQNADQQTIMKKLTELGFKDTTPYKETGE